MPDSVEEAQKWLSSVEPRTTFGDRVPEHRAQLTAITFSGLRRLGCDDRVLAEFPMAFQEGMETRGPALLSDTGDDKPEGWWWGSGNNIPDAALLLYADSAARLMQEKTEITRHLQQVGGSVFREIPLTAYDPSQPIREPFGFVDGISQPIVKGTRRWIAESDSNHVVEPGEFILGYLDNRGFLPLTPTVPATFDPHNILPAFRETQQDELPDFSRLAANGPRDLGRNGTFLVIRQLEQDVNGFNSFLSATATRLQGRQGVPTGFSHQQTTEWLAAKIVGRWRDGTSLVRYPHGPGSGWNATQSVPPDNSFLLGAEDPLGERCPFGSHIRRTNPRDSLTPGSKTQVDITNRHRILRMGRAYDPMSENGTTPRPGLLFMCLNADIERQFEFIQQTWASARLFHGLDGEVDPVLGRGRIGGRLTVPTEEGPILIKGIKDFVTVRGGAYFFLPSRRALRYLAGQTALQPTGWAYEQINVPSDDDGFESAHERHENLPEARPKWLDIH
jgi:deferrochelatase/peroxidase EfeB